MSDLGSIESAATDGSPAARPTTQHRQPGSKVLDLTVATVATNATSSSNSSAPGSKVMDLAEEDTTAGNNKKKTASSSTASSAPTTKKKKNKTTFVQMVHDAIVELGDRTGSSQPAIAKHVLANYSSLTDDKMFRSRLNQALKSGVRSERFAKVKSSFKIHSAFKKKQRQQERRKKEERRKRDQEARRKKEEDKRRRSMTPEQERAKVEREEAERRRAERLRKRRFPMEDTRLHAEDVELGVRVEGVSKRPTLPYVFHVPHAPIRRRSSNSKGKTSSHILTPSKVEQLEYGNRGLVPDVLQIYHFFRGDVQYCSENEEVILVPEFSLRQLWFAVEEILNGNAKKSRMLPPLWNHLFVTCLRILTSLSGQKEDESQHEARLRQDVAKLAAGLSPASWGEVCHLYMETMERYYTSTASVSPNVLPPGVIDVQYLLRASDVVAVPMTPALPVVKKRQRDDADNDNNEWEECLPDGYCAYLGEPRSSLARAHGKLAKQDPWNLTAEELMALLRALTDDILACSPEIGQDISKRDEQMYELLRAKRNADTHFRKIRLAYEGPKKPSKSKTTEDKGDESEDKQVNEGSDNEEKSKEGADDKDGKTPKFKPTATKKQFESAKKAQQKAHDAYQKGLRNLVARTEPVGYDRHRNAVYYFNHDPDMLYVEMIKPPSVISNSFPEELHMNRMSWHVIETKSMFDDFVASLDIRGRRENDLYESLVGPEGGHYSLRRGLYDDIKERSEIAGRKKSREDLERRLDNAKIAVDAEEKAGRRSGRLQSRAQIDLAQVEEEIRVLKEQIKADSAPKAFDYEELTGLDLMKKFDGVGRRTRRSRELKALSVTSKLPDMLCTKLIPTGNLDGTGAVGMVVADLLELEERCNSLVPWERGDVSRDRWTADLEEVVHVWNNNAPVLLGPAGESTESASPVVGTPSGKTRQSMDPSFDSKRMKLNNGSPTSSSVSSMSNAAPAQILAMLKKPLLDLEQRVFEITGLATATQDADEADENMSTTSDDAAEEQRSAQERKEKLAWRRKVYSLRSIDTRRHSQIRQVVVEAIAAARRVGSGSVVAELRSALLLHHPNAAGECKYAALAVLDKHGGYEPDDDEDVSDEESVDGGDDGEEEEKDIPTLLSGEAMMITGNLNGDDDANRVDWIDAVKSCKTLSRWAALAYGFTRNASVHLEKIEGEHDALFLAIDLWKKEEERRARSRNGKPKVERKESRHQGPTEVWANVEFTHEFCMTKLEGYPWWPSKKCKAKDSELAASLHSVGRVLVSLFGEDGGLRAVKEEDVRPFDGKMDEEDLESQPRALRTQLEECMTMTRRIIRGRRKERGDGTSFVEEKKTAME